MTTNEEHEKIYKQLFGNDEQETIEPAVVYEPQYVVTVGACSVSHENIAIACKLARILFEYDDIDECFDAIDEVLKTGIEQ